MTKNCFCLLFLAILTYTEIFSQNHNSFFYKGADISFLSAVEDGGGIFKLNGTPADPLALLQQNGINAVRLRLWNNPAGGYSNIDDVIYLAGRAKALGLRLLLDFHFSDTWADPGHQTKPLLWNNLSFSTLADSVREFSRKTILSLKQHGITPSIIQPGNEISCGMLWNDGNVCGEFNTPLQWSRLAELLNSSVSGIREALSPDDTVKIMIHSERSGDLNSAKWFFTNIINYGVQFDIMGFSYYPWWHGTLDTFQYNMNSIAALYGKDIIIAETAYPFTTEWNDTTHNIVGSSTPLLPSYPASIAGQKSFIERILDITGSIPGNRGRGVFYWAPEYISAPGFGSSWENLALFDFGGNLLQSASAFLTPPGLIRTETHAPGELSFRLRNNYPNPFNPETNIEYEIFSSGDVRLDVYSYTGELLTTILNEYHTPGIYSTKFHADKLPSGVYFLVMRTSAGSKTIKMTLIR